MFRITTAQLTKAITGVDYKSGPHSATKKKTPGADSTTATKPTQSQAASSSTHPTMPTITGQAKRKHVALATTSQPPQKKQKVTESSTMMKACDQPKETNKADDTLTTDSSDEVLPPGLFG